MNRVARFTAVVAAVGLVLAGCGNGPKRLSQDEFFTQCVAAEMKAGWSRVAMTLTTPGGQNVKSSGQMRYGTKPVDTAMAMTVQGQQSGLGNIEIRLVDQAFYIRLGALTGNKFAKIDLTDPDNPIARQYGSLVENIDPCRQVQQYENAVEDFDNAGDPVTIDGVKAVPYKVTIDPSKVKRLKKMSKDAPKTLSFTMYLGPDNLPRRVVSITPGAGRSTKLRMDYSHWGDKVVITAPAKSQISTDGPLSALGG